MITSSNFNLEDPRFVAYLEHHCQKAIDDFLVTAQCEEPNHVLFSMSMLCSFSLRMMAETTSPNFVLGFIKHLQDGMAAKEDMVLH